MLLLGYIRSHDVIFGLYSSSIKQVTYSGIGQYAASNCISRIEYLNTRTYSDLFNIIFNYINLDQKL